ncbi:MAG: PAS domain S-box protein [Syntrophobacterales bacterium]|jgi:PAS domain S-box-containing protein
MTDRHDKREQPEGNHFRLCQRIAELEGVAGQLEIDPEKLPQEVQNCTLAETINDGLAMIDENMQLSYANSRFCEIIGYSRDEIIGRLATDFLAEAEKKILTKQVARRKAGKRDPYELAWIRKDGQKTFVLMSPKPIFAPDGSFKGSIAVVTDITDRIRAEEKLLSTTQELEVRVQERTADLESVNKGLEREIAERKRVEKELRESEQRYSSLFKNNHSVMLLIDPESAEIMDANPAACFFYGWSEEELTNMKITDINMLPKEEVFQEIERAKSEKRNHFFFRHRLANEEIRDVEVYSGPISLHGKELLYSIIHDISERKRTERELRESKDLFEKVFESQRDALFILDGSVPVKISDCNPAATRMFGYDRQEMLGNTTNFLHVDEASLKEFQKQLQPAVTEQGFFHLAEFKMKRKNGTVFPTEHTVLGLENEQGERIGWVSVVRDITERGQAEEEKKKLEGQLLQTKKLEAISTLSGGVAQELSNLFQAVHGYVERLMWGKEHDDPKYQELLEITNAAFRGAVLSKRLLAFSGIIESKKRSIDLNQEIKKVHKLLMRTMPETIKLELNLANEITIINGDPNQIEQALLALAVNARDAMPGGGKIIIETKRMILDDDFLRTHAGAAMGECALITVSDTGPGLGQKTLEHVFDPFYSREENSEKPGLGLSMVYGIVKNHGGYISCSSEREVGTTFMIYLPITEEKA